VVEAGVAARGPRARLLVEREHVVAPGAHVRDRVLASMEPQPDRVLVEADRAVEVGDGDVHWSESHVSSPRMTNGSPASSPGPIEDRLQGR
jgi:hypothetical protein